MATSQTTDARERLECPNGHPCWWLRDDGETISCGECWWLTYEYRAPGSGPIHDELVDPMTGVTVAVADADLGRGA